MKVVECGYKIDLHIHSIYSKHKDKAKVSYNTLEHVCVLASKLNENGVQICAITDHDAFGYDIYKKLKEYEYKEEFSIKKVFPGVEFSVDFRGDNGLDVPVHVIAIFDDSDDEKIRNIGTILSKENGVPDYDHAAAFSEVKFLEILREINIDTVLIAHQKSSLYSSSINKDDIKGIGDERFNEIVNTEYFEAFEFKNRRNEVFNKAYLSKTNREDMIRFITGSDCHNWEVYPQVDKNDNTMPIDTYVKCLPTFKGLVMAITDHNRIKRVNSFFNSAEKCLDSLNIDIDGINHIIPLSRGINVIIGDNSIGKSLLLHALTNYDKLNGRRFSQIRSGYKRYLKENGIRINSTIPKEDIFVFDMQGEVGEKFANGNIQTDAFLKDFYPKEINTESYKEIVRRELDKIYGFLDDKFKLENDINTLGSITLKDFSDTSIESLTFIGEVKQDIEGFEDNSLIISDINEISEKMNTLSERKALTIEDKEDLKTIKENISKFIERFVVRKNKIEKTNLKIASFNNTFIEFKNKYCKEISDVNKQFYAYTEGISRIKNSIISIVQRKRRLKKPVISIPEQIIDVKSNNIYKYSFNSRVRILSISNDYINRLIKNNFNINYKSYDIFDMTQEDFVKALSEYTGAPSGVLKQLKEKVNAQLMIDFEPVFTITESGNDKTKEFSAGFTSQIYFDILSYSSTNNGIYIIDQPEDNISQKSIRESLMDRFKNMGELRQVIIVTHNPQFIVNLDVDNVIYIGKNDDGNIIIQSGALEYQNEDYKMLDIISLHIEGGLDTLRRRWKRYEKNDVI